VGEEEGTRRASAELEEGREGGRLACLLRSSRTRGACFSRVTLGEIVGLLPAYVGLLACWPSRPHDQVALIKVRRRRE